MATNPKRPRDTNQLAKAIVDIATGEQADPGLEINFQKAEVSFAYMLADD